MKKETDLVYELGKANWLDSAAGEAYILGSLMNEPRLAMEGTRLAGMIREIPYSSEQFALVIACGKDLLKRIDEAKTREKATAFLDEIAVYENGRKTLIDWEYDLIMASGRYQINMIMPEYYGKSLDEDGVGEIMEVIKGSYSRFDSLERSERSEIMGDIQKMDIVEVRDGDALVYRMVDFNHECGYKRGQIRIFYFNDYSQVMGVWERVKVISGRKT